MEQMELRTTKDQINEFKESILWADMIVELNKWKEAFRMEQESIVEVAAENNSSTASVLLHMGDINGRIKAVDFILDLPDLLLSFLEVKDGTRRDKTD
jgi:hypothetical protein